MPHVETIVEQPELDGYYDPLNMADFRSLSVTAPPPYTSVEVSALGSPVKKSDYVDIDVDLRWLDTESTYTVRRGTKEELLKEITPVKKLLSFTHDGTVDISPPQSAKSDTKVTVEGSYQDLMQRIDVQVRKSMKAEVEAAKKAIRQERMQAIEEILLIKEYERNFCVLLWKRVIQDQVYKKMVNGLKMHFDDAKDMGFNELINEYTARYRIGILMDEDLDHLRSPPERTKANELVHPVLGDVLSCYKSLMLRLRADEDDAEMSRYGRYYQWGTGDTTDYNDDMDMGGAVDMEVAEDDEEDVEENSDEGCGS